MVAFQNLLNDVWLFSAKCVLSCNEKFLDEDVPLQVFDHDPCTSGMRVKLLLCCGETWGFLKMVPLQGGAPQLAKLVYNSHNYGLWQI